MEQLSHELGCAVDRIVVNDRGACATRERLGRECIRGRDPLAGTKVVVWEFAVRELVEGDWKLVDLTVRPPSPSPFLAVAPGAPRRVTGTVSAVTRVPRPGSVPYQDHVMALHLVDAVGGGVTNGQALVYALSMQKNEWTSAARLRTGDEVTLTLRAWSEVARRYEAINRSDLDDEALLAQPPCWGELSP